MAGRMTEAEYRAHPAIAQSTLKLFDRSPAHALWSMNHSKAPTDSMVIGTCLHALVLEGKTEFVVMPESAKGNTNAAKAVKACFLLDHPDKITLSHDDAEKIQAMARSISLCSTAAKLLRISTEREKKVFWREGETEFKGMLDGICSLGVVDLKTTLNASASEFERSIYKYGYHVQAAHYLAGAAANNMPCENFYIIAVENTAPFCAAVYKLDQRAIEVGEQERQRLITLYQQCISTGVWPGYPDEIQSVTLPYWAFKKQIEENDDDNE